MQLQSLTPMLWTSQLAETLQFYQDILGFTCSEYNEDWGWASLYKDEVELMLARPNMHTPFQGPVFTGSFYFRTSQVDELWEQLREKVKVCYPPDDFEHGMREFAIYDNNGYLLQFGQEIEPPAPGK